MAGLQQLKESEKTTEKYLVNEIVKLGGKCYKWQSINRAGVPDRLCFIPGGRLVMVEVKSEGKKPTEIQAATIEVLRNLGFDVFVVDTKAAVQELIKEIKNAGNRNS